MQAVLNRQIFTTTTFDSGSLGVLASVIHQFTQPGRYLAVVRRNGVEVSSFVFEVSDGSPNMQLDFDLAAVGRPASNEPCDCDGVVPGASRRDPADVPVVSSKGYVLFYASRNDGGFSIVAGLDGAPEASFDSTCLGKGDLFAVTLLAPARYEMRNDAGKARGRIAVKLDTKAARHLANLGPVDVGVTRSAFSPAEVQTVSGQAIVFRIADAARIVIEQTGEPPDGKPSSRRRRFTLPRATPVKEKRKRKAE
jgi:hypothetical protein